MDCELAHELMSARLDNEASAIEVAAVEAHRSRCSGCETWWMDISAFHRVIRLREAEEIPDLTAKVLAKAHPPSPGRGQWVRGALAVVALAELAIALPGLLAGEGEAGVHTARHVGSFGSAVAIGLLYVAWKPVRAFGLLPIVIALAFMMFLAAIVDVSRGRASGVGEISHAVELAGMWLVWLLAGRPWPRRLRALRHEPSRGGLRAL